MKLFDRDLELTALRVSVEATAAGQEGRVLGIEASAGLGKTALMHAVADEARRRGLTVLTGQGAELERGFGFGVVRQLFEDLVRRGPARRSLLRGSARLAGPLLGLGRGTSGPSGPGSQLASLHALYWLTANLAERQPVALLVDDAHWADRATLRFLTYLARRLEGLPVLLVIAARPATDDALLAGLLSGPRVQGLFPGPLSPAASARVVRDVIPDADDGVCRACFGVTGGNPCYLRELALHLAGQGSVRGSEAAALAILSPPAGITRRLAARLAALGSEARGVAHALAVLGDGADVRLVCALADLDPAAASRSADALRAAGILDPKPPLSFKHPILAAAVREDIAVGEHALLHARAARSLASGGASPERVANHLLVCEPSGDPWVRDQLRAASLAARNAGAPETAVTFLRRALAESADPAGRPELLLDLGTAELEAGELEAASGHLRDAYGGAVDPTTRVPAALALAAARAHGGDAFDAVMVLEHESQARPDEHVLADQLLAEAANYSRFQVRARVRAAATVERLRLRFATQAEPSASILLSEACEMAMAAEPASEILGLARRALDHVLRPDGDATDSERAYLGRVLGAIDDAEGATCLFEAWFEDARRRGSPFAFATASVIRAEYHFWSGAIPSAEADSRTARELALDYHANNLPMATGFLVASLAEQDRLEEAGRILAEAGLDAPAGEVPDIYTNHFVLFGRARWRRASGDDAGAIEDLLECGRRETRHGEVNPAFIPWRSEAAYALIALGRTAEAAELSREELELARRSAAPRALGTALRAVAAHEAGWARRELLEEAGRVLEPSRARLEYGRTLADLGHYHATEGDRDAAPDLLLDALEVAEHCGSVRLGRHVTHALRAIGLRPRRAQRRGPEALTGSERRVAELAASGLSNRDIAQALFVTVRTVEYHLGNAYRKLAIHTRAQLPDALAAEGRLTTGLKASASEVEAAG